MADLQQAFGLDAAALGDLTRMGHSLFIAFEDAQEFAFGSQSLFGIGLCGVWATRGALQQPPTRLLSST